MKNTFSKRIILARHTETEWQNVKDPESHKTGQRLLGRSDIRLSLVGIARAKKLGERLRSEGVGEIFHSTLLRAVMAKDLVAEKLLVPTHPRDALREIDFGTCEGLTFEEIAVQFPDVHQAYSSHLDELSFPEGESFASFASRVIEVIEEILSIPDGGTKLIITHGGAVRVATCFLLGWPLSRFWQLRLDYGAFNIIGVYGEDRIIECLNQRVVLEEDEK